MPNPIKALLTKVTHCLPDALADLVFFPDDHNLMLSDEVYSDHTVNLAALSKSHGAIGQFTHAIQKATGISDEARGLLTNNLSCYAGILVQPLHFTTVVMAAKIYHHAWQQRRFADETPAIRDQKYADIFRALINEQNKWRHSHNLVSSAANDGGEMKTVNLSTLLSGQTLAVVQALDIRLPHHQTRLCFLLAYTGFNFQTASELWLLVPPADKARLLAEARQLARENSASGIQAVREFCAENAEIMAEFSRGLASSIQEAAAPVMWLRNSHPYSDNSLSYIRLRQDATGKAFVEQAQPTQAPGRGEYGERASEIRAGAAAEAVFAMRTKQPAMSLQELLSAVENSGQDQRDADSKRTVRP